jgi:hypothetical protein
VVGFFIVEWSNMTAMDQMIETLAHPYFEVSASYTRPNDTTAYTAGDALSDSTTAPTVLTFSSVVNQVGGAFCITDIIMDSSANPGTLIQPQLWLFDTAPTPTNDNAALSLTDAEALTAILVKSLGSSYTATNNSKFLETNFSTRGKCTSASTSLYGLIKVLNAYTPVANETITVKVKGYRL